MPHPLSRRVRQGLLLVTTLVVPRLATAAPFPADSLVTIELPDASETCRFSPLPMEGACEGLEPDMAARFTTALGNGDAALGIRGVALVRRSPGPHVVMISEYPNPRYVAKLEDLKRIAEQIVPEHAPGARVTHVELRDGGLGVGSYGEIRLATNDGDQPVFVTYFTFFGDPKIHAVQVITFGDEASNIAFGRELVATTRLSPQYRSRSLSAPVPVDVSAPLGKVSAWIVIAALVGGAWWLGKRFRK